MSRADGQPEPFGASVVLDVTNLTLGDLGDTALAATVRRLLAGLDPGARTCGRLQLQHLTQGAQCMGAVDLGGRSKGTGGTVYIVYPGVRRGYPDHGLTHDNVASRDTPIGANRAH